MTDAVKLYNEFNGKTCLYKELPYAYGKAAQIYWEEEFDFDISDLQGNLYGCVTIPMKTLIELVMDTEGIKDEYSDFDSYHDEYMTDEHDEIPQYTEQWAVILSNTDCDEIIFDGWHRFHRYYEQKREFINCLFIIGPR